MWCEHGEGAPRAAWMPRRYHLDYVKREPLGRTRGVMGTVPSLEPLMCRQVSSPRLGLHDRQVMTRVTKELRNNVRQWWVRVAVPLRFNDWENLHGTTRIHDGF